jgi:hypothetical protein
MSDSRDRPKVSSNGSLLVKSGGAILFIGSDSNDVNQVVTYNKDSSELQSTDLSVLAPVPPGGIIMWSGTIETIPVNFFLCNGQLANGRLTPNLLGRFVVCAEAESGEATFDPLTGEQNGLYGVNSQGGEIAHQLTIPELPTHVHEGGAESGTGGPGAGAIVVPTKPTGEDNYHENRPPYYALAYIMFSPVDYRILV